MSERFVLPLSGNLNISGLPLEGLLSVGSVIFNDYILELSENDAAYIITARKGSEVQTLEIPKSGGTSGEPATDEDIINLMLDTGMMPVLQDTDGAILVDGDNAIILI